MRKEQISLRNWRGVLHEVIFEADTKAGKIFDVLLIAVISASMFVVVLDSVAWLHRDFGRVFWVIEWIFTIAFSIEYLFRIVCLKRPHKYIFSTFGLIDLLAILPTYLSWIFVGSQSLIVIRSLRLLRIFRVLKLVRFLQEATILRHALWAAHRKILVFLFAVMTTVVISGALMHFFEGAKNGFSSIPAAMYWSVVTITTVGYGDIVPHTFTGKIIATGLMITGYAILAVPTGIFTVELVQTMNKGVSTQSCPNCTEQGHEIDAAFCKFCGTRL